MREVRNIKGLKQSILNGDTESVLQGDAAKDVTMSMAIEKYVTLIGWAFTLPSGIALILKWLIPMVFLRVDALAVTFTLLIGIASLWVASVSRSRFNNKLNGYQLQKETIVVLTKKEAKNHYDK